MKKKSWVNILSLVIIIVLVSSITLLVERLIREVGATTEKKKLAIEDVQKPTEEVKKQEQKEEVPTEKVKDTTEEEKNPTEKPTNTKQEDKNSKLVNKIKWTQYSDMGLKMMIPDGDSLLSATGDYNRGLILALKDYDITFNVSVKRFIYFEPDTLDACIKLKKSEGLSQNSKPINITGAESAFITWYENDNGNSSGQYVTAFKDDMIFTVSYIGPRVILENEDDIDFGKACFDYMIKSMSIREELPKDIEENPLNLVNKWKSYNDRKNRFSLKLPDDGYYDVDVEEDMIFITPKDFNDMKIVLQIDKIDETDSDARYDYVYNVSCAGMSELWGRYNRIKGAEEAYAIYKGAMDFSGREIIAFKGNYVYRLGYEVSRDEVLGINSMIDSETKVVFDYILNSLVIK